MNQFKGVYKNKVVLITGNTGFKGSWLSLWLNNLGAEVYGLSIGVPTQPSNFEVCRMEKFCTTQYYDIRNYKAVEEVIKEIKPDFIFHLAAQAIVKTSFDDPRTTIDVNANGTSNILAAAMQLKNRCCIISITSDKCYENVEWEWGYRENDRLGGDDPYSASKGAAELIIKTYAKTYFAQDDSKVKVAVARAGNVIGGGDWAPYRLVPDAFQSWSKEDVLTIRSPNATRPWQHVLEPLSGYLLLGQSLYENSSLNGEAFNFGPVSDQNRTVEDLLQAMSVHYNNIKWNIDEDSVKVKESHLLKLNCDKALHTLEWLPNLNFSETVQFVVNWYKTYYSEESNSMLEFTQEQLDRYVTLAISKKLVWTL